jgi:S1-C subfamily serine protease
MSDLAKTFLRQGRSFLQAGDSQKAIELLEKAKVMVGDNRDLEQQVLTELIGAYRSVGKLDQAERCSQRLEMRFPQQAPSFSGESSLIVLPRSRWALVAGIVLAAVVVCGGAIVVTLVVMQNRSNATPGGTAVTQPSTSPSPAPSPVVAVLNSPPPLPSPAPPQPVPASAPAAGASVNLQDLLKDNVGLVVIVAHYASTASGQKIQMDYPIATGSAFAVDGSGVLLTNKHVTQMTKSPMIPPVIQAPGSPPLVKTGCNILVCLGADRTEHYQAKLLHESSEFDMAVLKISRKFGKPLVLSTKPCQQGEDILACGYPGIVQQVLDHSAKTPAQMAETIQKWKDSGHVEWVEAFSRDSFNSTLTKGIVSAPERNIDGASYLQMDATISHGNSGGPVMNSKGEAVGIATLGISEVPGTAGKYNFALLIDQFRDELEPYLHK